MNSYNRYSIPVHATSLLAIIFLICISSATGSDITEFNKAKGHWTVLGGYGMSHKGWGSTKTRVETADVILQYGYFLSEEQGSAWYRGRHEIMFELPFSYALHPDMAIITGINILGCWNFTALNPIVPYACAGGGPVYTNLDIDGMGSEINGNYQAGLGLHYFIGSNVSMDLNFRIHHISNAGTADPNEPLNSSKILFGLSLFM